MLYKQGSLLVLEQGEYSDFGYAGPFRVLRDIDVQPVVEEFKAAKGRKPGNGPTAFIAWLARAGYIEDVECSAWHLGDGYGTFAPEGYAVTIEDKAAAQNFARAAQQTIHRKITFRGPGYLDPV